VDNVAFTDIPLIHTQPPVFELPLMLPIVVR
jgi:hypothetical protein